MDEKLHEYQGCVGRMHELRETCRNRWRRWKEENPKSPSNYFNRLLGFGPKRQDICAEEDFAKYADIHRRKTRCELMRLSAAVAGVEFSYAAETAFVSPVLLQIGVRRSRMAFVWALSPLVGFFLTPLLGSLSDRCRSQLGRRRPFILILSVGVVFGLLLVPNGEDMGYALGDFNPYSNNRLETMQPLKTQSDDQVTTFHNITSWSNVTLDSGDASPAITPHPWGVFFTVLGTVFLDFDADACQSPARAYLLDVTLSEDHAKGLSTFTVMAGLGGFMGYAMGAIDWDETTIGNFFGGHVRAVFSLITILFVMCVAFTVSSFPEIPLEVLERVHVEEFFRDARTGAVRTEALTNADAEEGASIRNRDACTMNTYGAVCHKPTPNGGTSKMTNMESETLTQIPDPMNISPPPDHQEELTLGHYLLSIVEMPHSLRLICITNLFCWSAHVCYSLYFTDFVGEAVFGGSPLAPIGSLLRDKYEAGVRFGCWGMSMYSLSCACYSLVIERLIKRMGARHVYVGGLLTYSSGMMLLALLRHRFAVLLFSWTAGVMYSTLFTMPYLLVAHYHATNTFEVSVEGKSCEGRDACGRERGLGTDVAIVSSMVFLAQFCLSMCVSAVVSAAGSTTAVLALASCLAAAGAATATQIMYLDL